MDVQWTSDSDGRPRFGLSGGTYTLALHLREGDEVGPAAIVESVERDGSDVVITLCDGREVLRSATTPIRIG